MRSFFSRWISSSRSRRGARCDHGENLGRFTRGKPRGSTLARHARARGSYGLPSSFARRGFRASRTSAWRRSARAACARSSSVKLKRMPMPAGCSSLACVLVDRPHDLPLSWSWSACPGIDRTKTNSVPDVERLARADERAALGDVLRVVGEERVHPLVVDAQRDGVWRWNVRRSEPLAIRLTPWSSELCRRRRGAMRPTCIGDHRPKRPVSTLSPSPAMARYDRPAMSRPCHRRASHVALARPPKPAPRDACGAPDGRAPRARRPPKRPALRLQACRAPRAAAGALTTGARNPSLIFSLHAANSPDKPAILWRDRRLTYAQLDERMNRVGGGLQRARLRSAARASSS